MYKLLGISMDSCNKPPYINVMTKIILKGDRQIINLNFYFTRGYIISSPVQNISDRKYKLVEGKPYLEQVFKSEMIDWYYNYLFVDFHDGLDEFYNIYTESCTISIMTTKNYFEVITYEHNAAK